MLLHYEFPSTDAAELAASSLRSRMPLLRMVLVDSDKVEDVPDGGDAPDIGTPENTTPHLGGVTPRNDPTGEVPSLAFFPINSLAVSGFTTDNYPSLLAYNAYVDAPPFQAGETPLPEAVDSGELGERKTCRLTVSCDPSQRRQVEAIVRNLGGSRG